MPPGFSLAVIAGLADDVQISETPTGTSVKMSWPVSLAAEGSGTTGGPGSCPPGPAQPPRANTGSPA